MSFFDLHKNSAAAPRNFLTLAATMTTIGYSRMLRSIADGDKAASRQLANF